jgi:hypothetical protein
MAAVHKAVDKVLVVVGCGGMGGKCCYLAASRAPLGPLL